MHFSTKQFAVVIVSICIVGGVIVRGNYLLGAAAAILFGVVASGTLFLVYRSFTTAGNFHVVRLVIVLLFATGVLTVLTIPAWFNPDLGVIIKGHQIERATRSQLHHVFSGDPRFTNLDFQCNYTKCIVVRVRGSIKTESDLFDLRKRVFATCPDVSSRWLYWKVTVQESGSTRDDCDLTVFGGPANDSF
jgi:hypothetical protein